MAKINPITGLEEDSPVVLDSEGNKSTGVSPLDGQGVQFSGQEQSVLDKISDFEPEAPKVITATTDNAVVDRGTPEGEPTKIELTRDVFTDIQAKQNAGQTLTEEEKLLAGRVKALRDQGQSTEKIFGEEEKVDETLLSDVQAQDLGKRLASGKDSALEKLGLASIQFSNDERVTRVLKDQGFTDSQINQVLRQRDAQLATESRQDITTERISERESLLRESQARADEKIRASTERLQNQTQRLRSLRGIGRGTATETEILDLEKQGNELISANERKANLQLQKIRMEEEGAEAEAIASIDKAITDADLVLQEKLALNLVANKKVNDKLNLDFDKSIDSILGTLDAAGEDIEGIDREKSKGLGYLVKDDGSIYLNKAGNTVEFKSTGVPTKFSATEIDNFATSLSSGKVKFSDLDLDAANTAKVITAMNAKLDSEPGLATNSLKAERILKDLGIGTDEESIRTVSNLLKVNSEKEVREMIATDEFKNAAFVGGNQKLFDDLRKDSQSFKDIDRTFKGMDSIWNDFKDKPAESRAAMEQALIIMFNKMLDPGSVVREGEFDRTSQGQSILNQAEGWLQKLEAGGAGIKNEGFEDIVNIAGVLHKASQETVADLKDSYTSFAGDLGADPDFVNRFFETGFDLDEGMELDEEENAELDTLFPGEGTTGTATGENTFKTKSGKDFKLNFNTGDQTSGAKEIPTSGFTEQVEITRTGTNVAKDTNNPGNITADSIPAGQSKEEYGKTIGATGTYLSPNGREYFIFPDVNTGSGALQRDIQAKISGNSRNIKPTDTLERFQRVYVGEVSPGYLSVLERITGKGKDTPIKDINAKLLTQAVMEAEGFTN